MINEIDDDEVLLQVICLTYNHANTIKQTLDGFILQRCNFKFQIFVGDDCSSDGTSDIVREYARKYPSIIIPFIREKNLGAMNNAVDLRSRLTAKYVAYCEGDDYWIDQDKLQLQVDYLEANQSCRGCFHSARILKGDNYWYGEKSYKKDSEGGMVLPTSKIDFVLKSDFTLKDLIGNYIIHTATIVYRWDYSIKQPEWSKNIKGGDVLIQMLQLGDGFYHFINKPMSVYRVANGCSRYKNHDELIKKTKLETLLFYTKINEYFNYKYNAEISKFLKANHVMLFNYLVKNNDLDLLKNYANLYPEQMLKFIKYFKTNQQLKNKLNEDLKTDCRKNSTIKVSIMGIRILKIIKLKKFFAIHFLGCPLFARFEK